MADTIEIVLGGIVALIGKILFDWLTHRSGNANKAGERSAEAWELTIRNIVHDVMEERNPALREMFRDVVREELRK